jgi:hypothetical protein
MFAVKIPSGVSHYKYNNIIDPMAGFNDCVYTLTRVFSGIASSGILRYLT